MICPKLSDEIEASNANGSPLLKEWRDRAAALEAKVEQLRVALGPDVCCGHTAANGPVGGGSEKLRT